MKKLFFRASLGIKPYQEHGIMRSENLALFKYGNDWADIVQTWLRNCVDENDKRVLAGKQPCELEISIKPRFKDRSVEANALMWVIYDLQAKIINREGGFVDKVTPLELYNTDMLDYAELHMKVCNANDEEAIIAYAEAGDCEYRGHFVESVHDDDGFATLTFRETSSFWDTSQFTTFLEYKINELEQMGLDRWNDGEVKALIDDFKNGLKDGKK